jgi:hypothetical protein
MDKRKFLNKSTASIPLDRAQDIANEASPEATSSASGDKQPIPEIQAIGIPDEAYQPEVGVIPPQQLPDKVLRFQKSWFEKFRWLHFDVAKKAVLCHVCLVAKHKGLSEQVSRRQLLKHCMH